MKHAHIIYNPSSGKEIMVKCIDKVVAIIASFGYEVTTFKTTADQCSARDEARRIGEEGVDLVIAAGGDGTIQEVVSGLAPLSKRPRMAILPVGTTNDYARALKVPRGKPLEAARLIGKDQTILSDIGEVTRDGEPTRYFINIAAAGTMSEVTYRVSSRLKTALGYLAYVVKGAELLPHIKHTHIRVTHDKGVYDGKASLVFIALTNSVAGFEQIVPDAKLDDGCFTLLILKTPSVFEMIHLARQALTTGKHVQSDKLVYIKTSTVSIESMKEDATPLMINLDGEYGGDAPVTLRNLANHIEMIADTDRIKETALSHPEDVLAKEQTAQVKDFIAIASSNALDS